MRTTTRIKTRLIPSIYKELVSGHQSGIRYGGGNGIGHSATRVRATIWTDLPVK